MHAEHYHICTGDFNSWTETVALEDHLAHPPSQIPSRVGDPRPDYQHKDLTPNPKARTTNPRARGRLLLHSLNQHSVIIGNSQFQNNQRPYIPTTKHNTIVDYFIFFKTILPDVQLCTTHLNSWHRPPSPFPPQQPLTPSTPPAQTRTFSRYISSYQPTHHSTTLTVSSPPNFPHYIKRITKHMSIIFLSFFGLSSLFEDKQPVHVDACSHSIWYRCRS